MGHKKKFGFITGALVLAFVLIAGIFFKLGNMETTTKLSLTDYQIATLNATDGKINESKQNIVTKDLLLFDGIEIKLDEDATVSYKVFYYDEDKNFISASESKTADYTAETVSGAKYVKVLITPGLVDGTAAEVDAFNMHSYTSQITIVVNK